MEQLGKYQKKFVNSLNMKWFGLYSSTIILAIISLFFLGLAFAYYYYWVRYNDSFCRSQANTTLITFCGQSAGGYNEKVLSLYAGAVRSGTASFFLGVMAVSDYIVKRIVESIIRLCPPAVPSPNGQKPEEKLS